MPAPTWDQRVDDIRSCGTSDIAFGSDIGYFRYPVYLLSICGANAIWKVFITNTEPLYAD